MRMDYVGMAHMRPTEISRHAWRQMLRTRMRDTKAMAFVQGSGPNRRFRRTFLSLVRRKQSLSLHEKQLLKDMIGDNS